MTGPDKIPATPAEPIADEALDTVSGAGKTPPPPPPAPAPRPPSGGNTILGNYIGTD